MILTSSFSPSVKAQLVNFPPEILNDNLLEHRLNIAIHLLGEYFSKLDIQPKVNAELSKLGNRSVVWNLAKNQTNEYEEQRIFGGRGCPGHEICNLEEPIEDAKAFPFFEEIHDLGEKYISHSDIAMIEGYRTASEKEEGRYVLRFFLKHIEGAESCPSSIKLTVTKTTLKVTDILNQLDEKIKTCDLDSEKVYQAFLDSYFQYQESKNNL